MIVLLDNYDGCVYNLFQLIGHFRKDIKIVRNDRITPEELAKLPMDHLVISGGGSLLDNVGNGKEIIRYFNGKVPILGICLGYRMLCGAYGAQLSYMQEIMQGRPSQITVTTENPLFAGLPGEISGMRYHSMTVKESEIPKDFQIIAKAQDDGEIMGVQYKGTFTYGLQFHPESFMTKAGQTIMKNFLAL